MRISLCLLSFLSVVSFAREPIAPLPFGGWEESVRIANDAIEIVVVPAIGRLLHLSPLGGENLYFVENGLRGKLPPTEEGDWLNYGGDWLWPVNQGRWAAVGGKKWPPPRMLDLPWRGEAWKEADGSSVIVLRRDVGDPVFVQLERRFILAPGNSAELRIEQSIRRVYASKIPVVLWHISQVRAADLAVLGREPDSAFDNGHRVIAFETPKDQALQSTPSALLFHTEHATENKLGSDGRWIAARRGNLALLQWAEGGDSGGVFPDGGCSIVLYSNKGLGYTEIETQSVELDLAPGETLRNTLVYRLVEVGDAQPEAVAGLLSAIPPARDVIQFSPASPTPEDVIEVRVRTRESGGILHWGLNGPSGGWELPARSYWPEGSIAGKTGVAVDSPLPDPVDGVSVLKLGPFNHPSQIVTSLHAVVRWGDRWESRDGANYNLSLETHPDAAGITIRSLPRGVTRGIYVETDPPADEIRLFVNNQEMEGSRGATLYHRLHLDEFNYGPLEIRARAVRGGRVSSATTVEWKTPELGPPIEIPPGSHPFGATPGARLDLPPVFMDDHLPHAWEILLHAPNARFVEVEWMREGSLYRQLMLRVSGGNWVHRVRIPDAQLQYRYVVDGHRRFADPWSVDVDWRAPDGSFSHLPEHAWSLAGSLPPAFGPWRRPLPETWVIYELSIPDIAPPGSYRGLQERLDYIAGLGINAIEPLPITTFPGSKSWGYNPVFHMAPERAYGTPQELADLIAASRAKGLAFVFDIVLNHLEANAPLHRMHGPAEINPYFTEFAGFNWGFPKLDQQSEDFKRYTRDTLRHWVQHWGVDGYRYDATQWIKWSGRSDWGVSWMSHVVEEADPGVIQIAENLPSEPNMVKGTALDSEWDGHFRWRMRKVLTEGTFIGEPEKMREILDPRNHAYHNGHERMAYIESHDEERFVRELREAGYDETEAFRRHLAGAIVTLTVPGIPMLYAGQEWGEETKKVVGLNPLNWDLAKEPARAKLVEQFRELIQLRTTHPALHHDRIELLHLDNDTGLIAYRRPGVPDSVVVVLNVSNEERELTLKPFLDNPREIAAQEQASKPVNPIRLLPGQARVFVGPIAAE
jgi:1,4-alpha-glucan branching enzyme